MISKLFVGNLSYDTIENDLQDAFSAHGTVVEINLMMVRMIRSPPQLYIRHYGQP